MAKAAVEGPFEGYPFRGRHLDVGGHAMHYLDEGEGPTVVMVHGNPTWSYYYRNLVLALRDTHRVLVPDHIGMGLSDKPGDDTYSFRLEQRVADLGQLIEHAAPEGPITMVVHDWGGMIGLTWAVRNAERIERLVILNTAAFPLPAHMRVPTTLRIVRSPVGAPLVQGLNVFCRYAARHCVTARPLTEGQKRAYLAPYDSWSNRLAVLRFVQDIPVAPDSPGYAVLEEVAHGLERFRSVPTLLLWGMRDFVFDPDYLHEFERRMPWAKVHTFPEAGHYVLEDEIEAIRPLVVDFLASSAPVERS